MRTKNVESHVEKDQSIKRINQPVNFAIQIIALILMLLSLGGALAAS
jgi:hypothetical protein